MKTSFFGKDIGKFTSSLHSTIVYERKPERGAKASCNTTVSSRQQASKLIMASRKVWKSVAENCVLWISGHILVDYRLVAIIKINSPNGIFCNYYRSSRPKVFLGKGALKTCSKLIGEHPRRSVISIKFQSNFIEITLRHGCSAVNLLHIFRTPFPKNTSG